MTCQELSVCGKFQSAVCSHCNRRLCHAHITEHQKIISSMTNFSNDIETAFEQIKKESQKRKNTYGNILASANKWRRVEIEKIDDIYQNYLKSIESEREILNNFEMKLFEQLESHVRQPFAHLQSQKDVTMKSINDIQQTIQKIRSDNKRLHWRTVPTISLPVDIEHLPLNVPSISIPPESGMIKEKTKSSTSVVPQNKGRSLKRLVTMFANISSIEESKNNITIYLRNIGSEFRLPIVICSYLTAWYKKSNPDEKTLLLNEHVTTIQKYLTNCNSDFDVLIGLQAFFHNQQMKENKVQMMTFLLQFFLDHQCIDRVQIFQWYKNRDVLGVLAYKGFHQAKHLATPFIRSLAAKQTTVDQSVQTQIEQEPMTLI